MSVEKMHNTIDDFCKILDYKVENIIEYIAQYKYLKLISTIDKFFQLCLNIFVTKNVAKNNFILIGVFFYERQENCKLCLGNNNDNARRWVGFCRGKYSK